jgi:Heterokaryon incompatibility protein (HET)
MFRNGHLQHEIITYHATPSWRLHHLHTLDQPAWVWINGIYINQQSHEEKPVQTRRMSNVYHSAQTDLVWLGNADNNHLAMDRIKDLNQKLPLILQKNTRERATYENAWLGNNDLTSSDLPNTNDLIWHALGHIYSQTWYTRLWVPSRGGISKTIVVTHGSRRVEWNALATLATRLYRTNLVALIVGASSISCAIKEAILAITEFDITKKYTGSCAPTPVSIIRLSTRRSIRESIRVSIVVSIRVSIPPLGRVGPIQLPMPAGSGPISIESSILLE